jgi:hypothetical protein
LVPKSALRSKAKSLKFNIKKIIFQFHSYKNNYPIDSDGERLNLKWIGHKCFRRKMVMSDSEERVN